MIIDPDFADHWKTRLLVDLLGGDKVAPVYIIRLWAHCQLRRAWVFDSITAAALKAICHYEGDERAFDAAMVQSGFIERGAGGALTVHEWDMYNASLIANWKNGKLGGRPKKDKKPTDNPQETDGLSVGKPSDTYGVTHAEPIRCDVMGGLRHSSRRHSASDDALVDNSNETTTDDDLDDHQNPNPQTSENDAGASGGARDDSVSTHDRASGVVMQDDGVSITFEWLKSVGVKVEPDSPLIAGWNKAGVTRHQIELGVEKCKPYKLNGVPAAYLAPAIEEMLNPPERAAKRVHVGNDLASVQAAARSIGLDDGRIGEQLPEYRRRVLAALDKGQREAV